MVRERVELYVFSHFWAFMACYKVNFTSPSSPTLVRDIPTLRAKKWERENC